MKLWPWPFGPEPAGLAIVMLTLAGISSAVTGASAKAGAGRPGSLCWDDDDDVSSGLSSRLVHHQMSRGAVVPLVTMQARNGLLYQSIASFLRVPLVVGALATCIYVN